MVVAYAARLKIFMMIASTIFYHHFSMKTCRVGINPHLAMIITLSEKSRSLPSIQKRSKQNRQVPTMETTFP